MRGFLEKTGGIGAFVAAAACPVCFPKLALLGALIGFGALGAYESQLFLATQILILLAMIGHAWSYMRHRNGWLLACAMLSGAAVFAGIYAFGSEVLAYAGFAGIMAASATQFWQRFARKIPT